MTNTTGSQKAQIVNALRAFAARNVDYSVWAAATSLAQTFSITLQIAELPQQIELNAEEAALIERALAYYAQAAI
jgi:hypothetical protein